MMRVRKILAVIAMLTAFSGAAHALTVHSSETVQGYYEVWEPGTAADRMAVELQIQGMIDAYIKAESSLAERHLPGVICAQADPQAVDYPATSDIMPKFGAIAKQGGGHLLAVDVVLEMMRKHSNCAVPLK